MNFKVVVIAACILVNIFGEHASASPFGGVFHLNSRGYSQDEMSELKESLPVAFTRHKRASALSSASTNMAGNRGGATLYRTASMPNLGATSAFNRQSPILSNSPLQRTNAFRQSSFQSSSPFGQSSFQSSSPFGQSSFQSSSPFGRSSFQSSSAFGQSPLQRTNAFRQSPFQRNSPSSQMSQSPYRSSSMLSASSPASRPGSALSRGSLASLTPSQSASQAGTAGRYETYANKATNILRPIDSGANILLSLSSVAGNVFSMYQSSILTNAQIKAHEEQARANALLSDVNRFNFEQKKADVGAEILRFKAEIGVLERHVTRLENLNKGASPEQIAQNNLLIEPKKAEIDMKNKQVQLYESIVASKLPS